MVPRGNIVGIPIPASILQPSPTSGKMRDSLAGFDYDGNTGLAAEIIEFVFILLSQLTYRRLISCFPLTNAKSLGELGDPIYALNRKPSTGPTT